MHGLPTEWASLGLGFLWYRTVGTFRVHRVSSPCIQQPQLLRRAASGPVPGPIHTGTPSKEGPPGWQPLSCSG